MRDQDAAARMCAPCFRGQHRDPCACPCHKAAELPPAPVYGVVCPTGEINLTDPDPQIAWHHAERANDDCPCGTDPLRHVVRRMLPAGRPVAHTEKGARMKP